ncbi:small subunit ribosomal protein S8 [Candidatus Caldarchaeum subterraneum]|uniref:Small subunit ribosomal protein S8 n=2 Tax=Caldiarchaeum subterraneum TaxID=311458 RepID=E6N5E9_CALS0|nr:small subunit ribosomal protein S8 [Candidatus Caldarchaeum subterraneum]BAJ50334.1 small subunit ribosomal protein S8 [Candidatus Caldarchaeum subterraneum]
MTDLVSALFTTLQNNEMVRNRECIVKASNLVAEILKVLQRTGYIGAFEYIDNGRGGLFRVQLLGRINRSAPIRPRMSVKANQFEMFEQRYLPARNVGILVVTTPKGVMSHEDAKKMKTGGRLLGYVY